MMMTRLEALKAAHEHVQDLYAVKNDRGYPKFAGNVRDVISEELRVAEFLLQQGPAWQDDDD